MADYLYQTIIYTDTANVIGTDNAAEATNKADFEANFKVTAKVISSIVISTVTFITNDTYTAFKVRIDGVNLTWADVKYAQQSDRYILYLITANPL